MPRRIGLIEADEIERYGRLSALVAAGLSVVDAAPPAAVQSWTESDWRRFDAIIFGVTADHDAWDRYGCVDVVQSAHAVRPNLRFVGLYEADVRPLAQLRLAEVGMHRIWPAKKARTAKDLASLVAPRAHAADTALVRGFDVRGAIVGQNTRPSAVIEYVRARGFEDAFDDAESQADTGLSRRQIIKLRKDISVLADLSVPSGYATGGPDVDRSLPSWRSVVDYVNLARGYVCPLQTFSFGLSSLRSA